ncbi:hypothetical protein RYX36_024074, partial [Vicia faba]
MGGSSVVSVDDLEFASPPNSVKTLVLFGEPEMARVQPTLFGIQIIDYMIVVFTDGDALENDDLSLDDDYLGLECPESLK